MGVFIKTIMKYLIQNTNDIDQCTSNPFKFHRYIIVGEILQENIGWMGFEPTTSYTNASMLYH
jgi:hypothetical protein